MPDERWRALLVGEPPEYYGTTVELEDGRLIETVVAPSDYVAAGGGVDVSAHGSWRAYKAAASP